MATVLRTWKVLVILLVAAVAVIFTAQRIGTVAPEKLGKAETQSGVPATKPATEPIKEPIKEPVKEPVKEPQTHFQHQTSTLNGTFFTHPPRSMDLKRADRVKDAFLHAWRGYRNHAWGRDTINPKSNTSSNDWFGWGITLVDSLDTLLLMGLEKEFEEALEQVDRTDFTRAVRPPPATDV